MIPLLLLVGIASDARGIHGGRARESTSTCASIGGGLMLAAAIAVALHSGAAG